MKGWEKYARDVETGKIPTGRTIKEAVQRYRNFMARDDMYFDEQVVDDCINFISNMKHFLGKSVGKPFILEPWQQFVVACILGFKWKDTGFRVCRETYIQIARKAGKDALLAAIILYLMIAEGEASPQIVAASNSTNQSRIMFDYITKFAASLDSSKKILKPYRNYLKCPANDGMVQVISSDSSKADGLNLSAFCIDEYHEARDRRMYDVLKSSQGMRNQPLAIIITTAGFNLDGPCHDMYELAIQVLAGVKKMDNFFPFVWELDQEDDWKDPVNFIKCQPNLGVTVTKEFMLEEVHKAEVDSTAVSGVLTKTFNKWVQSRCTWIPQDIIARLMEPVDLENYRGYTGILGCDLSTVSDFSSISLLIPPQADNEKYVYKTWTFLPEDTIETHPNKILYQKFIDEGSMIVTPGNVIDTDFIVAYIGEISRAVAITGIYLDRWNATSTQIALTEAGFNVNEFSQSIGNYNACTKEYEKLVREGKVVIDRSANVLWQHGNVFLKQDFNGNCKPSKESASKKIDSVISMTTALGGYLKQGGIATDFTIFSVC